MKLIETKALSHLTDLGAFDVPNPIIYKAITLRRLLDEGYNYKEAKQTIDQLTTT